jgi:hypothetical protein
MAGKELGMNQELLEKTAASRLTRRTIVSTGTKLAYAAPVVAASMKLGTRLGFAASGTGGENEGCFHSLNGGCMGACAASCKGDAGADSPDPNSADVCAQLCDALCPVGSGGDNPCSTPEACLASHFSGDKNTCAFDGTTVDCTADFKGGGADCTAVV